MARLDLDLARTSVFLDFDGTISTRDVGIHLLERTGADGWWALHEEYERGEIGSRECMYDQWALVEGDEAALRAVAAEVPLDEGFAPLVNDLRERGAEVTVLSDGFGFYVEAACAPHDVQVLTNAIDFATRELLFPHEDRCCPCSSCGVCKQAPIKDAKDRGQTTVLWATAPATVKRRCSRTWCSRKTRLLLGAPHSAYPRCRSRRSSTFAVR